MAAMSIKATFNGNPLHVFERNIDSFIRNVICETRLIYADA